MSATFSLTDWFSRNETKKLGEWIIRVPSNFRTTKLRAGSFQHWYQTTLNLSEQMLERTRKECLSHICIIHDVFHRLLTFFSVVLKTESERSLFFSWLGMIERWLLSQVGHEILWKISRYIYIYIYMYTWHINTSRICKLDCCDTEGNYNSNNDVWPRKMTWNDVKWRETRKSSRNQRIS